MADFNGSKCYALTIGVGKRENDGEYMNVTAEDARCVAEELKIHGKYHRVTVLASEQSVTTAILAELDELIEITAKEPVDLVVIYFSGHGAKEDSESSNYFLVCHDTEDVDLKNTAIKGSAFVEKLVEIKSEKLLIILDCCHADGILSIDIPFPTDDLLKKNNRVIISSSHADEKSKAGEPVSLFTFALLNGLAGQFLQENQKNISLFDLAMFTREVVVFRNREQHPQFKILDKNGATNDFTIIHYPNGKRKDPSVEFWHKSSFDKGDTNNDVFKVDFKNIPKDEEYRKYFKPLIAGIKEEIFPIVHFKTVEEIIKSSRDEILFKHDLTFFTAREKEQHQELIKYLKINRTCLLLGHPATGKSIAIVEIAKQLEKDGISTYYYSFKTKKAWESILEEMARYAGSNIVFVIDDIHLDISKSVEAYNKLGNFPDLKILFISRIVIFKDLNEIDIYEELKEYTVKTEEPSLDEKAEGIIKKFQKYYQEIHPTNTFTIGLLNNIINRAHRNLIVLREYLKIWETSPQTPLGSLQEKELYKVMYDHYFGTQNHALEYEDCLLQYLTLYYFEISFYANPHYLLQTEALAKNDNRIVKEDRALYSIYHGEYAHLLLKSYRSIKDSNFNFKYKTWDFFFFQQVKNYLLSFKQTNNIPENLMEILYKIVYFTKEIPGIVEDIDELFKKLILNEEVGSFILNACQSSNEDRYIRNFMFSISFHLPESFKSFFEQLSIDDKIFQIENSLSIYASALYNLNRNRRLISDLEWLNTYDLDKIKLMAKNSDFNIMGNKLNSIKKINSYIANSIYQKFKDEDLVQKAKDVSFDRIGYALINLKAIDPKKTKSIYQKLKEEDLAQKAKDVSFDRIGYALNNLKAIDPEKTISIYQKLKDKDLVQKAKDVSFEKIGNALNNLKAIDPEKTKSIYQKLKDKDLVQKAKDVSFEKIGNALNELKAIDSGKTKSIYQLLKMEDLVQKAKGVSFDRIGNGLNNLKAINEEKTLELYAMIGNQILLGKLKHGQHIYKGFLIALTAFPKVNPTLAKNLLDSILEEDLFHWIELKRIGHFNLLAYTFQNAEADQNDVRFKRLLEFGMNNIENYFRANKLSELSPYIMLMNNYFDLKKIVQNKLRQFHDKIVYSEEKKIIAEFIRIVHKIEPDGAVNYLLNSYQRKNPNELEVIGYSNFFIGKNLIEKKDKESAKFHLNNAKKLLSKIDDYKNIMDEIDVLLEF